MVILTHNLVRQNALPRSKEMCIVLAFHLKYSLFAGMGAVYGLAIALATAKRELWE